MYEATLAELADIGDVVNGLPGEIGGEYVRDRWNQRASVVVTDMGNSVFVSDSLHNSWRQGHATLGTRSGDGNGADGSTWVVPQ